MKLFVVFILFTSTLFAEQKIPLQACLHAKYGHTLGGTMHSKTILAKRLLNKVQKTLPFSDEKALIMIEEKVEEKVAQTIEKKHEPRSLKVENMLLKKEIVRLKEALAECQKKH